jgi:hypothetical protein
MPHDNLATATPRSNNQKHTNPLNCISTPQTPHCHQANSWRTNITRNPYKYTLHFPTADNFTTAPLIGEPRALELAKLLSLALFFSPSGKHPDDSLVCELGGLGYFDVGLSVGVRAEKNGCMVVSLLGC